jgi:sterol desaturase/sphingolipid hydroxylase (fatty acid hydroxylase superfamily)
VRAHISSENSSTGQVAVDEAYQRASITQAIAIIDLFVVQVIACAASFCAHVFFDKEYHVEGSRLQRFAWFRRKQALHHVHHRHADSNFAVIDFFWDRILGTYRRPDPGA